VVPSPIIIAPSAQGFESRLFTLRVANRLKFVLLFVEHHLT
jgi:hypothetical protein